MTKEQIDILNESIANIKLVCSMQKACIECPMNSNCGECPSNWNTIKYDEV